MSITPIEGGEERDESVTSQTEQEGVRARLRSWLASVSERVRSAIVTGSASDSDTPTATTHVRRTGEIRVGGQRRLADDYESVTDDERAATSHRGALPGSADIDAKQEGDTLCVYNPKLDEEYISSDTWEPVER